MVLSGKLVATLGPVSAILAGFVPGVLEQPRSAAVQAGNGVAEFVEPNKAERLPIVRDNVATVRNLPTTGAVPPRRAVIPLGCERPLSPLVRSASAVSVSRCLT